MLSSINEERFKGGIEKAFEKLPQVRKSLGKFFSKAVPVVFVLIILGCIGGAIYVGVLFHRGSKSSSGQTQQTTSTGTTGGASQPGKQPAGNNVAANQPNQPSQPAPPPWAGEPSPGSQPQVAQPSSAPQAQVQAGQQPIAKCVGDLMECALANRQPHREVSQTTPPPAVPGPSTASTTIGPNTRIDAHPGCQGTMQCWFLPCDYKANGLVCPGYLQNDDKHDDVQIDLDNVNYTLNFADASRERKGGYRTITFEDGFRGVIPHGGGQRQFTLVIHRPPAEVTSVLIFFGYADTSTGHNPWIKPIPFTVPVLPPVNASR